MAVRPAQMGVNWLKFKPNEFSDLSCMSINMNVWISRWTLEIVIWNYGYIVKDHIIYFRNRGRDRMKGCKKWRTKVDGFRACMVHETECSTLSLEPFRDNVCAYSAMSKVIFYDAQWVYDISNSIWLCFISRVLKYFRFM